MVSIVGETSKLTLGLVRQFSGCVLLRALLTYSLIGSSRAHLFSKTMCGLGLSLGASQLGLALLRASWLGALYFIKLDSLVFRFVAVRGRGL